MQYMMNDSCIVSPANDIFELLDRCPRNQVILDNLIIAWSKINSPRYDKILCSISGGADSDVVLDICFRCDPDKKIIYVWFDTGLEYQATKDHLEFLEKKYGIEIERYKAKKSIPWSCKNIGQPFLSKRIADSISRLQRHDFKWEDKSFDELYEQYPKCKAALRWWCNNFGGDGRFNIGYNKYLKEFILENPPDFKISNKCCDYAKKDVVHKVITETNADLNIYGVRKAEGGSRASAYKNCFSEYTGDCDEYRPLFWYKSNDVAEYKEAFGVSHSLCYTEYGLTRTGCAGCPFGKDFEFELDVIQKYEPKLYQAVNNIFVDSYEYTRKYRQFLKEMKEKERSK